MRIWIFNHYASPPDCAAGTRHYDLGRVLTSAGHEVTVFASSFTHFAGRVVPQQGGVHERGAVVDIDALGGTGGGHGLRGHGQSGAVLARSYRYPTSRVRVGEQVGLVAGDLRSVQGMPELEFVRAVGLKPPKCRRLPVGSAYQFRPMQAPVDCQVGGATARVLFQEPYHLRG